MEESQNNIQEDTYPTTFSEAHEHDYKFWKTKPVLQLNESSIYSTQITDLENSKKYTDTPLFLPESMKWIRIENTDNENLEQVVVFLNKYYENDELFKTKYSVDFIKWVLGEKGYFLAITKKATNALCGCIGVYFKNVTVFNKKNDFAVASFLCAHPIFRKKNISKILMDELTRVVVRSGITQGCFSTDRYVPSPVAKIRYFRRPLNYMKLYKLEFSEIEGDENQQKKYDNMLKIQGDFPSNYLKMKEKHLPDVLALYKKYMMTFNIHCNYTVDDLKQLLFGNSFVRSYVVKNSDKDVIDFFSYYELPYSVENTTEEINAGYLFLHTCNEIATEELIENLLRIMKNDNIDVANVTDIASLSGTLLSKDYDANEESDSESYSQNYQYKFMKGTYKLNVNFFNWKCPSVKTKQIYWFSF